MQPIEISSDNDYTSSIQPVACKKSGCGMTYTGSEAYHNRTVHQESLSLKRPGVDTFVHRDTETGRFLCPICSSYENIDPSNLRVSTEQPGRRFPNSLNFSHISRPALTPHKITKPVFLTNIIVANLVRTS